MNLPKGKLEGVTTNSPFTASAKIQGDVAVDGLEVAAGGAGSVVLADLDISRLSITKNGYAPFSSTSSLSNWFHLHHLNPDFKWLSAN